MRRTLFLTLVLSCVAACGRETLSKQPNIASDYISTTYDTNSTNTDDCGELGFRFIQLTNELYSEKVRNIEVFLDERAFAEKNLATLFRHLSDKNPQPEHLTIVLKTRWEQLAVPTACPKASSSQAARSDTFDYHQAIFYRRLRNDERTEYFQYNPVLKTANFETVVLKPTSKNR